MMRSAFLMMCLLMASVAIGQETFAYNLDNTDAIHQQDEDGDDTPALDDGDATLIQGLESLRPSTPRVYQWAPVCATVVHLSDNHRIRAPPFSDNSI